VSKTLGGAAERLNAGCTSPQIRETASSVYHVVSGNGFSTVDGQKMSWKEGDTFCIPAWNSYKHHADQGKSVYLYRFDDKPMLKTLGCYRTEGMDVESLVSE
jgi:gentisate 1,2-dioxygenase